MKQTARDRIMNRKARSAPYQSPIYRNFVDSMTDDEYIYLAVTIKLCIISGYYPGYDL